jgi:hypothetical protein
MARREAEYDYTRLFLAPSRARGRERLALEGPPLHRVRE